jgi:hypothetical protein
MTRSGQGREKTHERCEEAHELPYSLRAYGSRPRRTTCVRGRHRQIKNMMAQRARLDRSQFPNEC